MSLAMGIARYRIKAKLYCYFAGEIFEPYVPPANEGKSSIISNVVSIHSKTAPWLRSFLSERTKTKTSKRVS